MDCYPEPTVLPREPDDRREAEELSRILPVIMKNNRFKKAYSQAWWNKLKSGCAVYGVFWDGDKLHGLGDVSIRSMDVLNLFWEPGVQDIQESENFFCTELVPNRRLEREYPQLEGKLGRSGVQVSRYLYDDKVDTSEQSLVVDWYLARLELRMKLEEGAVVKAFVRYDNGETWEQVGTVTGTAEQTRGAVMQLRPRRCGHLRLKLMGLGRCRVYSAAAVYEKGSDVE